MSAWTPHRPGGAPSTAITLTGGGSPRLPGVTGPTARIDCAAGALGHYVERVGPPLDLRPWQDLWLWVRSNRVADGSTDSPFYLEVRIGSVAAPAAGVGNPWRRLAPVDQRGTWQAVPLSLADLPAAVAAAATTIRVTCVDASLAWSLSLDAIIAVVPQMLVDADHALVSCLDGQLSLNGSPVPAVLAPHPGPAPTTPVLRLSNYDVRPDRAATPVDGPRTDFTGAAFSVRAPATVYQLDYAIEALAADRASEAMMIQLVLDRLSPTALLVSAGRTISAEWIDQPSTAAPPVVAPPPDHPVVHVRLRAAQPGQAPTLPAVRPFNDLAIVTDQPSGAG